MKQLLFIACFFASISMTFSQNENIIWQEDSKLTWENFKGAPWEGNPMHAMTAAGPTISLGAEQTGKDVSINFVVTTIFSQDKSWAVKGEYEKEHLLKHEQLHFDIAELFSRKIRKALQEFKFTQNFQEEYKKIYNDMNEQRNLYQQLYDKETEHSNIVEKQKEWEEKVAKELAELDEFKGPEFTVTFTLN